MNHATLTWMTAAGAVRIGNLGDLSVSRDAVWRWVDISAQRDFTLPVLAEEFGLHPLAVEDALHQQRRPKYDQLDDGAFISWLYAEEAAAGNSQNRELDVFIGSNYLITLHDGALSAITEVSQASSRFTALGVDWLLHAILDRLVDSQIHEVDRIGDTLDEIESALQEDPLGTDLPALYEARRQLFRLHRIVSSERDVLRELMRHEVIMSAEVLRYYEDVGDHLAHIEDAVLGYREIGASLMELHLSSQNTRMNEIMKQLTVVATIFMPLTLISGIYGMNLLHGMWPPVDSAWSFGAVVSFMLVIASCMAIFFRRVKWW